MLKVNTQLDYPKLRYGLEPFKVKDEQGHSYIGLRDPLELSPSHLLIPVDLFFLLQFFDGDHSTQKLCAEYQREFGNELSRSRLIKMLKKLDQAFLLQTARAHKRQQEIENEFRNTPVRQPAFAGNSYPGDAASLRKTMTSYVQQAKLDSATVKRYQHQQINGVLLPHIDPRLAGASYSAAHSVLQQAAPVDVFIILGISHQAMSMPFALTLKDFSTPLGMVSTNESFVTQLAQHCEYDFFQDEFAHRKEHSIEFQVVFLRHFQQRPFTIVPVLCSFSHVMNEQEQHQLEDFVNALKTTIVHYSGRVCTLASVDLAHIGPQYGDAPPDSFVLAQVEQFDRKALRAIAEQDVAAFDALFLRTDNRYNVCGYPAIRTLLQTIQFSQADLLSYENAIMDQQRSTVTFSTIIFSN